MAPTRRPPLPWKQHYETKERTPLCTGWLLKKKQTERQGVGRILNGGANRRFFTLDFDGGIFYYCHSASQSKQVSKPISVDSIARVELVAFVEENDANEDEACSEVAAEQSNSDNLSVTSKTSSSSLASRLFRFSGRRSADQVNGFVIHFHGASEHRLELMCESKSDTDRWVSAFEAAMKTSGCTALRSTGPTSEEGHSDGGSTAATPRGTSTHAASESD